MRLTRTLIALTLCIGGCSDAVDDGQGGLDVATVAVSDASRGGNGVGGEDTSAVISDAGATTETDTLDTAQDAGQAVDDVPLTEDATPAEDISLSDTAADVSTVDTQGAASDAQASTADSAEDAAPTDAIPGGDVGQADTESTSDANASDASSLSDVSDATSVEDGTQGVDVGDALDVLDAEEGDIEVLEEVDSGPPVPPKPLYLLSVNNAQKTLEKINVETGEGTDVCQLPATSNYPSLTFSRDNILFASRSGQHLDAIDPCTCEVSPVGSYNGFTGVNGITSDFGLNLFGVSHVQDVLISINSQSGSGTSIGPLGVNFGYTGATWSDEEQLVYAIDATSDGLYTISPQTGEATFIAPLSLPLGTVGIEMHPANGILYACSDPGHLLAVDLITGEVTDLGDMGQNTACNNLAAPWKEVPCLDDL
jgi:hypothetical protein